MADQNLATDMSGHPIRRPTAEELIAEDVSDLVSYDMVAVLPDGARLADTGGKYYPIKDDGHPDWDHPLDRSEVEGRIGDRRPSRKV